MVCCMPQSTISCLQMQVRNEGNLGFGGGLVDAGEQTIHALNRSQQPRLLCNLWCHYFPQCSLQSRLHHYTPEFFTTFFNIPQHSTALHTISPCSTLLHHTAQHSTTLHNVPEISISKQLPLLQPSFPNFQVHHSSTKTTREFHEEFGVDEDKCQFEEAGRQFQDSIII